MSHESDNRGLLETSSNSTDSTIGTRPGYPSVEESTAKVLEMLDDTADLIVEMTEHGPAPISAFDGLVLAALVRSKSTSVGFLAMIAQKNKLCAEAMVLYPIDSAMRLIACMIAKQPRELARHLVAGGEPSKFTDVTGQPLTDRLLLSTVCREYPPASHAYCASGEFAHLSMRSITGIWDPSAAHPSEPLFTTPEELPYWDEHDMRATMTRFNWATSCLLHLCFEWQIHKQSLAQPAGTAGDRIPR